MGPNETATLMRKYASEGKLIEAGLVSWLARQPPLTDDQQRVHARLLHGRRGWPVCAENSIRLVQASESSDSVGLDAFQRNGPDRLSG